MGSGGRGRAERKGKALRLDGLPALGDAGQTQRLSGGSATRRVSDLGVGSAHHRSQKAPLTRARLPHSRAAVCITQQEPLDNERPRGILELLS